MESGVRNLCAAVCKLFFASRSFNIFLTLERQICWWPISGEVTYNGKVLHQYGKGYPHGSEIVTKGLRCVGHSWIPIETVSTEVVPTEAVSTEVVSTEVVSTRPRELVAYAIVMAIFIVVVSICMLLASCYVPTYQPVSK